MDERLYEAIARRKSFHVFRGIGDGSITSDDLADIMAAISELRPLDPAIRTAIRIIPAQDTNCRVGAQYCILFYSEEKDDYLRNIGYLGEQLDLRLVSRGIGTLWFGLGKTAEKGFEGLPFVIMIAVARVDDESKFREDISESKRKPVGEIWSGEAIPGVTDVARYAPSAVNSQPWRVENDGESLRVCRCRRPLIGGVVGSSAASFFNRIDMGIFLCYLELCLRHEHIGYERTLFPDSAEEKLNLNAVYRLRPEFVLRKAEPADRERIEALFVEMLRSIYRTDDVKPYEEGYLDKYFAGGEDWICVAQEGDETVAFLSVEVHREQENYLYLDDLSVTERCRNEGLGTALIERAEDYAREIGIPAVVFHVEKSNEAAFRLYTRLGYTVCREDGSRLLMEKRMD
jgi:ribosomal protein S18 acetylase RimI-like enzyme